jgi:hypothetical protein
LLMDGDEMSNLYRGPSKDASYQVFLIGWFLKNLLLWKCLDKWTEIWWEASMAGPLWILLNLSRSINKHGHHRQFLFLIGWFLKIFSSETA